LNFNKKLNLNIKKFAAVHDKTKAYPKVALPVNSFVTTIENYFEG
jgi:hypothetical protein